MREKVRVDACVKCGAPMCLVERVRLFQFVECTSCGLFISAFEYRLWRWFVRITKSRKSSAPLG